MSSAMILAGLLMAQAPAITVEGSADDHGVGFSELATGRPEAALERIAANSSLDADDPAALINQGSAHARLGHTAAARDLYFSAVASRQRYELELADGRWMDSRAAARLAIRLLEKGRALALK